MAFDKQQMKMKITLIACIAFLCYSIRGDAEQIGVNYGENGNNLPSADQVVTLMKNNNIGKMRMFSANKDALKASANSGIEVVVGILNSDLQGIASSQDVANGWVTHNIKPFYPATNIKYIAVGNEVLGMSAIAHYLLPAMNNIQTALESANLQDGIKVSTTHATTVVGTSYPPSSGTFSDSVKDTMSSILQFLEAHGSPFMANVYPYFSYISNEGTISLDYALFRSTSPVLTDGNLSYTNLFDAMVDTFLSAMESLGHSNLPIVITESGWPSQGNDAATTDNAETYTNNLIKHVLSTAGTPKRPGTSIDTYIFALFNEDLKAGDETERHYGLFYPNQRSVYPVNVFTTLKRTVTVTLLLYIET